MSAERLLRRCCCSLGRSDSVQRLRSLSVCTAELLSTRKLHRHESWLGRPATLTLSAGLNTTSDGHTADHSIDASAQTRSHHNNHNAKGDIRRNSIKPQLSLKTKRAAFTGFVSD